MTRPVPAFERLVEELVGNRIGAGVYRTWAERLGLRGDERVLDAGAGGGALARHLAQLLPDGSLTCIDVSEGWIDVARRRLRRHGHVEYVAGDICDLHRPRAFDVVVLHFVLHDVPPARRAAALHAIVQALAPGGRLLVREPLEHGMSESGLLELLARAGLRQNGTLSYERLPLMGRTISGAWG